MAITLRSRREIELMRKAGAVVANVLSKLKETAKPGVNTGFLDDLALQITTDFGAEALFKGVPSPCGRAAFPGAICTSINEQVVHGIPSRDVILTEGDILSIDYGARINGYCGDAAVTIPIGRVSKSKARLMEVTEGVLGIAVKEAGPGVKWSQVAGDMQKFAESAGFSVVRDFVGHGIGKKMHEEPKLPNFVNADLLRNDIILAEGMVLAVEPMINAGKSSVRTLKDGWTVVTRDGKCSAHFEHTIVIVNGGCEVMTKQ